MSQSVFGQVYADQYDLLYSHKDYEAECDMLEEAFRRYGEGSIQTILDLGCGTGNHAIPLSQRGYQVTGVDLSAEMLEHARQKASLLVDSSSKSPAFFQGDVRSIDLSQQFDAVLMMFAVLGYQLTNEEVAAALRTVRRHLRPGGLFVFDVWYGPAVLAIRPGERVKVIPTPDGQIIRAASGSLDIYRHLCEVRYHLWRIHGNQVESETEEVHMMRYFFSQELALLLECEQMLLVDIRSFECIDSCPSQSTWNIIVVGRIKQETS